MDALWTHFTKDMAKKEILFWLVFMVMTCTAASTESSLVNPAQM